MTTDRARLLRQLERAIRLEEKFVGAIVIGSSATTGGDDHSDLDFYVFVDGGYWEPQTLTAWLAQSGLVPSLHYWTGVHKHRLLIDGIRVDLAISPASHQNDLRFYPQLFFPRQAIFLDRNGVLTAAYDAHRPSESVDSANDYASYLFALVSVAIQILRGESINARSRFMSVIEARARLMRSLPLGSALWREPTRHAEGDLSDAQLHELSVASYLISRTALKAWVATALAVVALDEGLSPDARAYAERYAKALMALPTDSRPRS
jgi:hypothetical protein